MQSSDKYKILKEAELRVAKKDLESKFAGLHEQLSKERNTATLELTKHELVVKEIQVLKRVIK